MPRTFKTTLLTTAALISMGSVSAFAQASFTDAQKAEIGGIVKEYLMENPKVIFDAADSYRDQQEAEARKNAETSIKENIEILTSADAPSVGNPNGDVTVVEFFDYNCGYCKKALTDIQAVLKEDKNLRVVFKEMPILGPTSRTAALWALAAHEQGKYFDYHVALMEHRGEKNDVELEKIASTLGLDIAKMKTDIASEKIVANLDQSLEIARKIGVSGTPAFIIGTKFIPGYIGDDGLKAAVKEQRDSATKAE